jgi:hypothetical protein
MCVIFRKRWAGYLTLEYPAAGSGGRAMLLKWKVRIGFFAFLASVCLAASHGRDFSGSYLWTNPSEMADQVNVSVELSIRNSGASVKDAQIVMKGQFDDREFSNFLGLVSIEHGQILQLKGGLTLSKNEFDLWRKGRHPRFVIQSKDEDGNTREQVLELVRGTAEGASR